MLQIHHCLHYDLQADVLTEKLCKQKTHQNKLVPLQEVRHFPQKDVHRLRRKQRWRALDTQAQPTLVQSKLAALQSRAQCYPTVDA